MNRRRFGLLDTIESIPLETKKRLRKKYNSDEQGGNDKKYVETTYSELKSLRDEGKLIPGALYRITDYQCTTVQEGTRSAGHRFDIIVQALSENVLSEDAKAIQHKFEMPEIAYSSHFEEEMYYDGISMIEGEKYYKYVNSDKTNENYIYIDNRNRLDDYVSSDEYPYYFEAAYIKAGNNPISANSDDMKFKEDLREFSYFSDSNLAAWKLKYCLDNDEERFAWAKNLYLSPISHNKCIQLSGADSYIYVRQAQLDDENGLAWAYDQIADNLSIKQYSNNGNESLDLSDIVYTESENVYIGKKIGGVIIDFSEEGKGVIYQMIDEYNNDCPYDFKNIQFLRSKGWHNENTSWAEEVIGEDPNIDIYYFTFSWINSDFSVEDVSVVGKVDDIEVLRHAENNIINVYVDEIHNRRQLYLNNIILVSSYNTDTRLYFGTTNNIFRYGCRDCTFGDNINNNVFDTAFVNNVMSNYISGNKSFGTIIDIYQIGITKNKIIYMDSNATIYFKDIKDAFSET